MLHLIVSHIGPAYTKNACLFSMGLLTQVMQEYGGFGIRKVIPNNDHAGTTHTGTASQWDPSV